MVATQYRSVRQSSEFRRRRGAVLSVEWLLVFPILVAVMFAITEFSLLWSAKHLLEAATYAAAREASLPAFDEDARFAAAQTAAERILADPDFIDEDLSDGINSGYEFVEYDVGMHTGDPVVVSLSLPMEKAAPDLLRVIGISIQGKKLTAKTVMRRE
jgi:Flp pilus assembly protein TadG